MKSPIHLTAGSGGRGGGRRVYLTLRLMVMSVELGDTRRQICLAKL